MKWHINDEIILRNLTIADASAVYNAVDSNRTYLRKWLPWLDFNTSIADSRNFILDAIEGYKTGLNLHLVLVDHATHKVIGVCGFHTIRNHIAKFGYWLAEDWQGHGIISKSCQKFIDYAFSETSIQEIVIQAAIANEHSRRVAKKLGFIEQEKIIPNAEFLYDHHVDHVVYSLKKP